VTSAVAEHYALLGTEFAGIILTAGFTDVPTLLLSYSIGGYVPILSPLRHYPALQNLFRGYVVDKWPSSTRLSNFVRVSKRVRLFLIHAKDDFEIPCRHSDALFLAAVDGIRGQIEGTPLSSVNSMNRIEFGDGAFIATFKEAGNKIIREQIVATGGKLITP
jgi:abhydrolase domain-containing protein 12